MLYSVTLLFVTLFYILPLSQYYACAFGTCLTFFFLQKLKLFKEPMTWLNQSFRAFSLICSWTALILWSKDQLSMGLSSLASSRAAISCLPSWASEGGGHDENTGAIREEKASSVETRVLCQRENDLKLETHLVRLVETSISFSTLQKAFNYIVW